MRRSGRISSVTVNRQSGRRRTWIERLTVSVDLVSIRKLYDHVVPEVIHKLHLESLSLGMIECIIISKAKLSQSTLIELETRSVCSNYSASKAVTWVAIKILNLTTEFSC